MVCNHCGVALLQPRTGRRRRFCSNRCRTLWHRERDDFGERPVDLSGDIDVSHLREVTVSALTAVMEGDDAGEPIDRLGRAVQETGILADTFDRLSDVVPGGLGTRSRLMSGMLRDTLEALFPMEGDSHE